MSSVASMVAAPRVAFTTRDPWLDNARLVAAVGVVVGHCLLEVTDALGFAETAWIATWPFRIPVLVVVAGWFSSARPLTGATFRKLVLSVLLVYVLASLLAAAIDLLVTGSADFDLLVPGYGMWFLLSLFLWRLALPLVVRIPHLLAWSFAASVLVGFVGFADETLSVARTVALFPLFVVGHQLRELDSHAKFGRPRHRVVALATALAAGAVCVLLPHGTSLDALLMSEPYAGDLGAQLGLAVVRLLLLGAATLGAVALLSLLPTRSVPWVTVAGAGSLSIYVLHCLAIPPLVEWGVFARVDSVPGLLVMLVAAVAVALALGSPPVRRFARPLLRPYSYLPPRTTAEIQERSGVSVVK